MNQWVLRRDRGMVHTETVKTVKYLTIYLSQASKETVCMGHVYRPQTKFGERLYFYTCLSFCSQGEYLGRYPPGRDTPLQVHPPSRYTLQQVHPSRYTPGRYTPQVGTPSRYTPLGRYTPRQVHPLQVHPQQVHPPAGTPQQVHPQACTPPANACWDTVNKRVVCILLECILV